MHRTLNPRFVRWVGIAGLVVIVANGSTIFAESRDRTPPTQPRDLRVTAITPYSVSLAWTLSTDNSGRFSYVICCANVSSQTVE